MEALALREGYRRLFVQAWDLHREALASAGYDLIEVVVLWLSLTLRDKT